MVMAQADSESALALAKIPPMDPCVHSLITSLRFNFLFFPLMCFTSKLSTVQPPFAPDYVNAVMLLRYMVAIRVLLFTNHAMQHDCPICECQRVNTVWGIIIASPS